MVYFDLSWDNSWLTSSITSNWDAAWVFVKYRKATETTWNHAILNRTDGTGSGDGHVNQPTATLLAATILVLVPMAYLYTLMPIEHKAQ